MRLVKEQIQLEQPLGHGSSQAVVEGEITLPGGLREEARVLYAGASACVERVEALTDRLSAAGRVAFRTLYTQGDPSRVCAMEATADFTHLMDLPGVQPRCVGQLAAQVEHVEARAYGGRLLLRAVVRISGYALCRQPVEAVTGIAEAEGVQLRTHQAALLRTVAQGAADTLLREEMPLPSELQIRETLWGTAYAVVDAVTGGLGRAGVAGRLMLEVAHASEQPGRPVVITRHTLPLSLTVDLAGEEAEALQGVICVKDVAVASQEAGEGQRVLRAEILLGTQVWGQRQESLTLMDDAYTLSGDDLRLSGQTLPALQADEVTTAAESGRVSLMLPEGAPPVRSVLCAFLTPVAAEWHSSASRLTGEGMLEVTLLYMSDDPALPQSVRVETPFRAAFAIGATPEDELRLEAVEAEALPMTADRVDVRYVLSLAARSLRTQPLQLVSDVLPVSAEPPRRSIALYFTQPGEGLWDIARRYRVSVDSIRSINPELTGEPQPGQGVVVWRKE